MDFALVKRDANGSNDSNFRNHLDDNFKEPIDSLSSPSSSSSSSSSSSNDDAREAQDEGDHCNENSSKQLVLYEPAANDIGAIEALQCQPPPRPRFRSSRRLPSVGAFTVQCAKCFKWRLMPSKEKYEEIREHIIENPFFCETACEWRPGISCDDPTDISQDGSRLWAIDKPNIAQPPQGWQRLLRIRGEGSTKFADIYYQAPSGKRLRSMVEVQKFLMEHPEYAEGVTLSQFSFQIPRPLQEDYVRKRPSRVSASRDNTRSLESVEVNNVLPLPWVGSDDTNLQLGMPALPPPSLELPPFSDPLHRPAKQARTTP